MNDINRNYDRIGEFEIDRILKHVSLNPEDKPLTRTFKGQKVFMGSKRYQNFKANGFKCVECGFTGTYFALERHKYQRTEKYHFNLYGKNKNGKEIMLTKDHIVPKAKGGTDDLNNFQVMCGPCNSKKGDVYLNQEQLIHQAKLETANKFLKQTQISFNKVKSFRQTLIADCPHSIERTSEGAAICIICKSHYRWYCSEAPDKICQWFSKTQAGYGMFWIVKLDETMFELEGYTKEQHKNESEDSCIFCGLPEERI